MNHPGRSSLNHRDGPSGPLNHQGRFFRFTDTGKTNIPDRHMTISESRQAKYRENKRQTKENKRKTKETYLPVQKNHRDTSLVVFAGL